MGEWTGVLRLNAEDRRGKTVAKRVYFQGAFKVMRPIYHDDSGQVCYYLLNPGGGYLDGDRYKMKVVLEKKAKVTLTTQSSTKVYKTPNTYAFQESDFHLKEGSYLEYIPDPLIAYRNAGYRQRNIFRLDPGATLLYSDIITPGWSPEGEAFSYKLLQLINEIYAGNELVVYDHLKLVPGNQHMTGLGFMEGYSHLGSMIVVGEQADSQFLERLHRKIQHKTDQYKIGISMLPVPGFTVRILAHSTQMVESIFSEYHHMISKEWFDRSPSFLRKY